MADPLSPSPKCHQDLTSVAPFSKKTTTKKRTQSKTIGHTWTSCLGLGRRSRGPASFGDDPKPVRQLGIEEKDVGTPGVAGLLLDGVEPV